MLTSQATVWGAIQKFRGFLQQGDTVAVVGIGGLGQLGVQFCKALGYRTVAIDNHNGSLDLTEEMPPGLMPDFTVNSSSADATGRIMSYTRGEGLAAAVACTDPVAVNKWSLELLRVGGVLIPLGLPPSHWQFDPQKLLFRELVIRGNYVASKDEVDEMMRLVDQRGIRSQLTFVSRENIPNIMELYKARAFRGRLVVKF